MHLYNLTLQPPTIITCAVVGNFTGTREQQIIAARGTRLELLRPNAETGKSAVIIECQLFVIPRYAIDYLVVGSDSGRIVVLEYNVEHNRFDRVHMETYGKSGCRRVVPGEYLATDPKGRAIMIAAVEKQKFVYVMNRDSAANLTISSPLEAHKSHTILHDCIGVDVGYENPIFACLEIDYQDADEDPTGEALSETEKMLTYYELDLGLNHVVRRWSEPVDMTANLIIAVPGGSDGPSGVLVCSENWITYMHDGEEQRRVPIPRRENPLEDADRGLMIITATVHKMKRTFFILAQSEAGDIYKIMIDHAGGKVNDIRIKYFDTVPMANTMGILKSGFLFLAADMGNHQFYQFQQLGDDDDELVFSSHDYADGEETRVYFKPRELVNLALVDEMDSMCPLIDTKVINLTDEETPQLYSLCGRGARSSLRILRHGLEISEVAVTELPGRPTAIWTTKLRADDEADAYIVVSFVNATLVLSIGETVEEVQDSGLLASTPTLFIRQMGEDTLIQAHPEGVRHILADKRVNEWKPPSGRLIVRATANHRQVVVALNTGELVYFELDEHGQLNEYQERLNTGANVLGLALGEVPDGRVRFQFLAVACDDQTVRIFSLEPDRCFEELAIQALNAQPESLVIITMMDRSSDRSHASLFLAIGLRNGVLLRTVLDNHTGEMTDPRLRFLGSRPVKLFPVISRAHLVPISYTALECGSSFVSGSQGGDGIVAIADNTLRILALDKLGNVFNQASIPLSYTPRHFTVHPTSRNFVVIEAEHGVYSPAERERIIAEKSAEGDIVDQEVLDLAPELFNHLRAPSGQWASCIRLLSPFEGETLQLIELTNNEAAFSLSTIVFHSQPDITYLAVGTGADVTLSPRRCRKGYIHLYKFSEDDGDYDIPQVMIPFHNRLLVGVGNALRIYDLGKRKLLRKSEAKGFPTTIVTLHTQGNRIVVGDLQESIHFVTYLPLENRLTIFADDTTTRYTTATAMVDYDTVVAGDKFGNIFVDRLPRDISEQRGYLHGSSHKLQNLTNIISATLVAGGRDIILYTTLSGAVGILIPFVSRDDIEFFQTMEMHMRNEASPLCGRDHVAYRSAYIPVKNVIDGDLCESFNALPPAKKQSLAEELDRTPNEITKKLEDLRTLVAF
ncbi:mono-functional DNA-alkylating methyl methanesulfonate N-term-domain-containing protein [Syncephalis fuscata]|nr:mono-functional DNA-alkylating methyl methanesulfonate N-term-domain-containing protein [Syncephalis fuscata]